MNDKITKNILVDRMYEKNSTLDRDVLLKFTDLFINELKNAIGSGDDVELRGLGSFEPKLRKGRENARNPKTGEKVSVGARYTAVFNPGKEIKNMLLTLKPEQEE